MIEISLYTRPADFLQKASLFLYQHEIEHNRILSNVERSFASGKLNAIVLSEEGDVKLCALIVDQEHLLLSRGEAGAARHLFEFMAEKGFFLCGVSGPSDVTSGFVNLWVGHSGLKTCDNWDFIIYSLNKVTRPRITEGGVRLAQENEDKILGEWIAVFGEEALPKAEKLSAAAALEEARKKIAEKNAYVWEVEGTPVSAVIVRGTQAVARVGNVYTPPPQRGRGYATSLVAAVSQRMLEGGCKACCLYAEAKNPVSNSIYRKVGYEFVNRASLYVFDK